MKRLALISCLWLAGGCAGSVTADENEKTPVSPPPTAEFDPANQVIPFPNNLVLDPMTHKVALPAQACETPAAAMVRAQLNQLDGFGTYKPALTATFTAPINADSLTGRVFLVRLAGPGLTTPEIAQVDVDVESSIRLSAANCAAPSIVPNVTIVPRAPLVQSSTYGVLLLRGIKTTDGAEFQPSSTWSLVRESVEPVQLTGSGTTKIVTYNATPFDPTNGTDYQTIVGLDTLWNAHNVSPPLLPAFDQLLPGLASGATGRTDMLLAWSFNTETISAPFDATVAASPAAQLTSDSAPDAPNMPPAVAGGTNGVPVSFFYGLALPGADCTTLRCAAIGSIYIGVPALGVTSPTFVSPSFQPGGDCDPSPMPQPPGAWSDPLTPTKVCDATLQFVAVTPAAAPGPAGYKTVIFGHGITRRKEDLLGIAGALASQGIASIAIDAVDHGSRAIPISTDAAMGCATAGTGNSCTGTIDASCAPQCYAPILSPDLAVTRDSLRQTVLDELKLQRVLAYCATQGACQDFWVDADHIGFLGQSLGSLIGAVTVAASPNLKAAVLNVGGADWIRILTDTLSDGIRCPLVDALITAGILPGGDAVKWNLGTNTTTALCLTDSWKTDPGFLQFAQSTRWMLDPVDGTNYASMYASHQANIVLAEVVGDAVVPNTATDEFAALLGLAPTPASTATSLMATPTAALLAPGSYFVQYAHVDANAALGFPGNLYAHGSLLQPATSNPTSSMLDPAGVLGTVQMQTDTLTFLAANLATQL
ncbi:MAG TPA: hypothetical protein VGL13_01095 [Polyangiaceae bacterium]|jgi:dienelactone hydrolase